MNLEAAVVANCLGNLLSALILLLGYLLFELWRDYIAIICSAFLLSQALGSGPPHSLQTQSLHLVHPLDRAPPAPFVHAPTVRTATLPLGRRSRASRTRRCKRSRWRGSPPRRRCCGS